LSSRPFFIFSRTPTDGILIPIPSHPFPIHKKQFGTLNEIIVETALAEYKNISNDNLLTYFSKFRSFIIENYASGVFKKFFIHVKGIVSRKFAMLLLVPLVS
jgi:hypothetical protein